jgi:hypothetical protein
MPFSVYCILLRTFHCWLISSAPSQQPQFKRLHARGPLSPAPGHFSILRHHSTLRQLSVRFSIPIRPRVLECVIEYLAFLQSSLKGVLLRSTLAMESYFNVLDPSVYDVSEHGTVTEGLVCNNLVCMAVVALVITLRMYVRQYIKHAAGPDDCKHSYLLSSSASIRGRLPTLMSRVVQSFF